MRLEEAKEQIASLDVDAQKGFTPLCPKELPIPQGDKIAEELNQQAQFASLRIGSKDAHSRNAVWNANLDHPAQSPLSGYRNVDVRWPPHCIPGTPGFELISGLPHPQDYDFFVWKGVEPDMHPYGACYHDLKETMSTGLIEFLKAKHIKTLLVGGLATDFCVKTTVLQLLKAGFKVIVNLGACRGLTEKTTQKAIQRMKDQGALFINSHQELK